jgi:putative ABC transport system permease protein
MLRHLMKLIWKRKTRNLMLSLEILLAFVVVFAVAAFAARCWQLYQMPLGFRYDNVWSVSLQVAERSGLPDNNVAASDDSATFDNLKRTLQALPEVEQVGFAQFAPYSSSTHRTDFTLPDGRARVTSNLLKVSDGYFDTLGLTLLEGRWFSAADDGTSSTPVVINRSMAQTLAPGQSALGKEFTDGGSKEAGKRRYKVTGVIADYRDNGELMLPVNYTLIRQPASMHAGRAEDGVGALLLRLKPGTPRTFEARLNRQLKAVRNDWGYQISPLADVRSSLLRVQIVPLLVLSVIGAFLLVMVAFGLFGVLWQNTTQRIPEIGLRRAVGANGADIYLQIIAEQLLLSSVAMGLAQLLLVQLPLTGALGGNLNWAVFGAATFMASAVIYATSLLCALYPGWRASRLSPTQALHYE